jgi:hypothetical protein
LRKNLRSSRGSPADRRPSKRPRLLLHQSHPFPRTLHLRRSPRPKHMREETTPTGHPHPHPSQGRTLPSSNNKGPPFRRRTPALLRLLGLTTHRAWGDLMLPKHRVLPRTHNASRATTRRRHCLRKGLLNRPSNQRRRRSQLNHNTLLSMDRHTKARRRLWVTYPLLSHRRLKLSRNFRLRIHAEYPP